MSANSRQLVRPRNVGEIHVILVAFSNTSTQPGGYVRSPNNRQVDPQQNPFQSTKCHYIALTLVCGVL